MIDDNNLNIGQTQRFAFSQQTQQKVVAKEAVALENKEGVTNQVEQPRLNPEKNSVDKGQDPEAAEKITQDIELVKAKLEKIIPEVEELMLNNQRSLEFHVAENENRVIITVRDKETNQIIRQIPPEDFQKLLDFSPEEISTLKGGLILNSKA